MRLQAGCGSASRGAGERIEPRNFEKSFQLVEVHSSSFAIGWRGEIVAGWDTCKLV
jgi:hypothetical protein